MGNSVEAPDWSTIPAPADDGATRHLTAAPVPSVALQATNGVSVNLWHSQAAPWFTPIPAPASPASRTPTAGT